MKTRASNTERSQFKLEFKRGTLCSKFPNLKIKAPCRELNTIWRLGRFQLNFCNQIYKKKLFVVKNLCSPKALH